MGAETLIVLVRTFSSAGGTGKPLPHAGFPLPCVMTMIIVSIDVVLER
jgi:hypothetical protein